MTRDGNWSCVAWGGIGNKNGYDVWGRASGWYQGSSYINGARESGTGGLLTIYSNNMYNMGTFTANGINNTCYEWGDWGVGGGASGGGSVNIFANNIINIGNMTASGGVCTGVRFQGGSGGAGTITVNELMPKLIYPEKTIQMQTNQTHVLDASKLIYTSQNEIQTGIVTLGDVTYEVLDTEIATVDNNGIIATIKERKYKGKNNRRKK